MRKEDELAATNRLLQIIRGDVETPKTDGSEGDGSVDDIHDNHDIPDNPLYLDELDLNENEQLSPLEKVPLEKVPSEKLSSAKLQPVKVPSERVELKKGIDSEDHEANKRKSGLLIYKQQGELKGNIRSYLGLDIGSRYIKFVQIQSRMNKRNLLACGVVELPHHEGGGGGRDHRTSLLQRVFRDFSGSQAKVISAIGGPSVIVRHIKFPPLSDKEIEESIRWEAKTYIPFPLKEVTIDYQILARSPKNKQVDVLLVAVTKKLLQEHLDVLRNVQVTPFIVDINSLALVNSLTDSYYKEDRAIVLLDIGASTTILNIYKKNDFFFTRDIPIAGESFTLAVQKDQSISYGEAEKQKQDKKFNLEVIKPTLDNLVKEIRRSLIYYDNQTARRGFARVLLSGGSARLIGLDHYLSEELGLGVEIANPLRSLYCDSKGFLPEELDSFSPQLALAMGLANR